MRLAASYLLSVLEGHTFTVTNRLSGEECAGTLLARHEHFHVGSAKSSMISKAKTVLTLGYFLSSI